ncbi:DNA glycosylase [Phycomyces nitens]|nr:DNA glycosylase [Phycomyces nitens]
MQVRRSTRIKTCSELSRTLHTSTKSPYFSSEQKKDDPIKPDMDSPPRKTRIKREPLPCPPIASLEEDPSKEIVLKNTKVQKRVKTESISTANLSKKKKVKQEVLSGIPPANWRIVFDRIKAYRKVTEAPVDTMGCERLGDPTADPATYRFQTLVALMLSAQTKDTVTSVAVRNLQKDLPGGLTLESILNVDEQELDDRIRAVGFHTKKAAYIKKTAEILRDKFNRDVPSTIEDLTSLPGVGPKMGFLTLQIAWKLNMGIGVDVHVHRISNRLGWCKTMDKLPEDTRKNLESWLPKEHWREINPILVGYGQIVCLPRGPKCGECPVREFCPSSTVKVKKEKDKLTIQGKVKNEVNETTSRFFKEEEKETPIKSEVFDW